MLLDRYVRLQRDFFYSECSYIQVGDTSLPLEQPEMLDDDFLKSLHHVLLEVS